MMDDCPITPQMILKLHKEPTEKVEEADTDYYNEHVQARNCGCHVELLEVAEHVKQFVSGSTRQDLNSGSPPYNYCEREGVNKLVTGCVRVEFI